MTIVLSATAPVTVRVNTVTRQVERVTVWDDSLRFDDASTPHDYTDPNGAIRLLSPRAVRRAQRIAEAAEYWPEWRFGG